eukprot:TRINITY_DN12046_c0_g1_i3.p1 TRINITY_DN12046_c0_g1~~TRINITY_DN12046_c0_g1_i3.p1  ORF type:complete len:392 (+),score=68.66 TRINITY_DN12046_c0_g1_i3:404-1579(+)
MTRNIFSHGWAAVGTACLVVAGCCYFFPSVFLDQPPPAPPARLSLAARDNTLYREKLLKTVLSQGRNGHVNHYRYAIVKKVLQQHKRERQTFADNFLLVEYGSDLGGISTSIAADHPASVIISVDNGQSELDDGTTVVGARFHQRLRQELNVDNNAVCLSQLSLSSLASLRMTQLVFDYQLVFDFLEHGVRSRQELQSILQTMAAMALYTFIEVPARAHAHAWYQGNETPMQLVATLLKEQGVSVTTLTGPRPPHILLLHNRRAVTFGQPQGGYLCERVFTLLACETALDVRCGDTKQTELSAEKLAVAKRPEPPRAVPKLQPTMPRASPVSTTPALKSIPDSVCASLRAVPALVKCGPQEPRSLWNFANNGYYKCRNATHWLSDCRRFLG